MTTNQEQKRQDLTLKSLEADLRRLPEVQIPETLQAKILASVPDGKAGGPQGNWVRRWPRVCGIGIATAAVLILGLVFMANYALFMSSQPPVTDLNDGPTRYVLSDQNSLLIEDTNHVNSGGQR